MNIQAYSDPCCEAKGVGIRNPSIRERLEDSKQSLESQLKRVNDAITALEANPETAKVLELISKV
jgi:vacuolar-type H+-ATPase subunit E/Vma4